MDGSLSPTQRRHLERLLRGRRNCDAYHSTTLGLERLGLIRRTGTVVSHRYRGHPLVEWEITDAGVEALQQQEMLDRR